MLEKIKNWASDNKEDIVYGAAVGAYAVYCICVGAALGKRAMSKKMLQACRNGQSFHIDDPKEGVRYLFNFGTEKPN